MSWRESNNFTLNSGEWNILYVLQYLNVGNEWPWIWCRNFLDNSWFHSTTKLCFTINSFIIFFGKHFKCTLKCLYCSLQINKYSMLFNISSSCAKVDAATCKNLIAYFFMLFMLTIYCKKRLAINKSKNKETTVLHKFYYFFAMSYIFSLSYCIISSIYITQ